MSAEDNIFLAEESPIAENYLMCTYVYYNYQP